MTQFFSPVQSTLVNAIKNNHFTLWPGLTSQLIGKNLSPALATVKCHLRQDRQNIQSTKTGPSYKDQLEKIKIILEK